MKKLLFFFLFPFVAIAQSNGVMDDYYNSITDWNISSAALKSTLNSLISSGHTNLPYTSGSEDTWDVLQISDLISGSNNVSLIYGYEDGSDAEPKNDISRDKSLMSSGTCTGYWNREHIFPKSLATPALVTDSAGSGTDLHNLRAADCQMNSTRNNNVYGDGSGDSVLNSGVFFPGDGTGTGGDDYRGDVARAIMYMYIRYPSEINPNDVASSSNSYHDDMPDIFLEWNKLDAPSDIEKLRNNTFESKQGNRNPFIDNPYIAELIWGGPTVTDWWSLAAPRISFSSSSSVNETDGNVTGTLTATMLNYAADVTISVTANNSSTTAEGGDYTLNLSSWTFTSDNETKDIGMTIHNDSDNHDETIVVDVAVTSGSANLINSQYTVSVTDDEKELIITELADPNNSTSSRFVEIYNSSNKSVNLSTYYLLRWTNGGATPQSAKISLSSECGATLAANTFCIISNDTNSGTNFATMYGFEPDGKSGTGGAVDSNGDDNIAIITIASGVTYSNSDASTYTVIDMFGVAGEDGSGTAHEFEDGRAERKASSTIPSSSWVSSDWNVENDSGGGSSTNNPQTAPDDYDPGYWIGATTTDTWTGRLNTSWATAGNWSSGVVPASGDKIFIHDANNDPDISTDITLTDLTVKASGLLDIESSGSIVLSSNYSNSGTVNLNSSSSEYSSIIIQGTSSGNITYKRWVADEGSNEWDLIGSPVVGQTIASFVSANSSLADHSNQYAIGVFSNDGSTDSADAMYTNYTSDGAGSTTSINDAGSFNLGQGYAMATDEADSPGTTLDFTGTVRTTDVTGIAIDDNTANAANFGKWNLVANPYPSYLNANDDADSNASNNFLGVNASPLHSSFAYIYGYDGDGTYTYYNHLTPGSAVYIAPGQGFFVASDDSAGNTIQFTEAMQTVGGSDDFNAENSDVMNDAYEVSLRLYHDNQMIEETRLFFEENLGLGLDVGYDAGSFSQEAAIMTRLVEEDEGHGMAINAMGLDAMENAVIPLVINQSAGQEFRINLHTATITDPNVYLEDIGQGTFTNLYEGDFVYSPMSDLSGVGRFFIHMTADTMSNEDVSTSMLNAYKEIDASYITIEGLATQTNKTNISLYNILGRKVLSTTLNNNMGTQTISTAGLSAGIYVIELESGTDRLTKKLIIK